MGKFSDYINSNLEGIINANKDKIEEIKRDNPEEYDNINNLLNKYKNYSSDELLTEYLRVIEEKKRDGTLSMNELENFKSNIFPFLTGEQKQKFEELLNLIR